MQPATFVHKRQISIKLWNKNNDLLKLIKNYKAQLSILKCINYTHFNWWNSKNKGDHAQFKTNCDAYNAKGSFAAPLIQKL